MVEDFSRRDFGTSIREKMPHLAIASLLLGAISIITLGLPGPLAMAAGIVAIKNRRSPGRRAEGVWAASSGLGLGVIGCLMAAMAVFGVRAPSLFDVPGSASSAQARYGLGEVRMHQAIYKEINGRYAGELESLGFYRSEPSYYRYTIRNAGVESVILIAEGKDGTPASGERWCIKVIENIARKPESFREGSSQGRPPAAD